jgi:hypothetical protein
VIIGGALASSLVMLLAGPVAYARFATARGQAPGFEPDVLERWPGVEAPTNGASKQKRAVDTPAAPAEGSGHVAAAVDEEEGE